MKNSSAYHWPRGAACLAMALFMLVGCASSPATARQGPLAPKLVAPELVVAVPKGTAQRALETAAAAYTQASGEKVEIAVQGSGDRSVSAATALMAGLNLYDLVYLSAGDLAYWAGYRAIQPLTFESDQAALGPWLPAVSVNGKLYGLPTQPDPVELWYRSDLMAAPRDWESYRRAAQALTAPPDRYGAAVAGSAMDAGLNFAAVLAGFGGQAVSANGQVVFDDMPSRRALDFYTGLVQDRAGSGAIAPRADRLTRADVLDALRNGRAASGFAPLSAGEMLLDCPSSPRVCREGKPQLAWAPVPGLDAHAAVGDLDAWAVPLKAAHPAQAQRFIAWLGSEDGARAWAQGGGTPARLDVLSGLPRGQALAGLNDFRLAFPPSTIADQLWKACNMAVNLALAGKEPPDRALADAAEQMRIALRPLR